MMPGYLLYPGVEKLLAWCSNTVHSRYFFPLLARGERINFLTAGDDGLITKSVFLLWSFCERVRGQSDTNSSGPE